MSQHRGWSLKETLIVTVIGVVFAVLYIGWVQVWLIAQAALGWLQVWLTTRAGLSLPLPLSPLSMDVMMGFWFVASIVAAAVVRKPGVAFASEVLAAAVEILLGSPGGLILVLSGAIQGGGAEAVFAATRWRNYSLPVLMAAGVGAAVFSFAYTWIRFDYGALQPGILVAMFALRALSGALLGGWLGHAIVEALYRTGALAGLAIDRDKRTALA